MGPRGSGKVIIKEGEDVMGVTKSRRRVSVKGPFTEVQPIQ